MIYISKPFLPPQKEYDHLLKKIWKTDCLTNNGPFVKNFEVKFKNYLNLNSFAYVINGTTALQLAIRALDIEKEVITTPFTFVATTSSLIWENCKPVFVDIDKDSLNIDKDKIEQAVTKNTRAILATHCFGNPCEIDRIGEIAKKYKLKVIYDAAHCFGVEYKGKSIFNYGDISITSFHATKIFHTIEGGGVFSNNKKVMEKIKLMRSFGKKNSEEFSEIGINAKNSEFHAAMGLCNLKYKKQILEKRENQFKKYESLLKGFLFKKQFINKKAKYNYSYFPVIFESEKNLLKIKKEMEKNKIFPVRYFYPPLNKLLYIKNKQKMPIAENISKRILCLPMYHELKENEQEKIVKILKLMY